MHHEDIRCNPIEHAVAASYASALSATEQNEVSIVQIKSHACLSGLQSKHEAGKNGRDVKVGSRFENSVSGIIPTWKAMVK